MKTINSLFLRNMPRWIIFLIDIGICLFSLILAYLVRFNFSIPVVEIQAFPLVFALVLGIRAISFYFSKTFQGIIKYTSSKDAQRIFLVISLGSISYVLLNCIFYFGINHKFPIPFSIVIIDYMAIRKVVIITVIIEITVTYRYTYFVVNIY